MSKKHHKSTLPGQLFEENLNFTLSELHKAFQTCTFLFSNLFKKTWDFMVFSDRGRLRIWKASRCLTWTTRALFQDNFSRRVPLSHFQSSTRPYIPVFFCFLAFRKKLWDFMVLFKKGNYRVKIRRGWVGKN